MQFIRNLGISVGGLLTSSLYAAANNEDLEKSLSPEDYNRLIIIGAFIVAAYLALRFYKFAPFVKERKWARWIIVGIFAALIVDASLPIWFDR